MATFRALLLVLLLSLSCSGQPVVIASKLGAEPLILGEMMAQVLESADIPVERKLGLGPTEFCFPALKSGQIDLYVDYSGTVLSTLLKEQAPSAEPLQSFLFVQRRLRAAHQVEWLAPFGFDNGYALVMRAELAREKNIRRLSDLRAHQDLRCGFTSQFARRQEDWPELSKRYGLHMDNVFETDHALAYSALAQGKVDLIEAYTTDGELKRYGLVALEDDLRYFPLYQASPLLSGKTLTRYPQIPELLSRLAFTIDNQKMQALNLAVLDGQSPAAVASAFLQEHKIQTVQKSGTQTAQIDLPKLLGQHLQLTGMALLCASLLTLPLGVYLSKRPRQAGVFLGIASVIQTVPSMALLAFMIPIPGLGLGARSAVLALFLYSLLPILRNTITGLREIDGKLREAAQGLGMTASQILWMVELPLAAPTLMAGIRTAAVITVGTATLAAFIGAGGLGVPILTGLQLNDPHLILQGAIPSALLAISVDLLLGQAEKWVSPPR